MESVSEVTQIHAGEMVTPTRAVAPQVSRLRSVQMLRAVAALAVVVFHATTLWHDKGGAETEVIWRNGQSGVDLFFVISGFIILLAGRRLSRREGAAARFLQLRLIRLVPLYWLATSLKTALVLAAPQAALVHAKPGLWLIAASYLFVPFDGTGQLTPVLTVGWTLSFEVFFYLLFAGTLTLGKAPLLPMSIALGALTVAGTLRTADWPPMTSLADPLLLEFLAGMLVAQALEKGWLSKVPPRVALALLVGGLAGLALLPASGSWSRALEWGGAAALALLGGLALEPFCRGWMARLLVFIGEASYSLYLTHGFVLPVVGFVLLARGLSGAPLGIAIVLTATILSVGLAALVYVSVERPLCEGLRRLAHDRKRQASLAEPAAPI